MTEDQLEQEALSWLADVGYSHVYGPDVAVDGVTPERSNYTQVVLVDRLRNAINRLNPLIPLVARVFISGWRWSRLPSTGAVIHYNWRN